MSSEYDSRTTTDSNQDDETTYPRQPTTGSQVVWDVPNKEENRNDDGRTAKAERSVSAAQKLMKGGKAMFNTSERKRRVASTGSRTQP